MMIVTALEKTHTKLIRIYVDWEYCFSLYPSEIKQYQLAVDQEVDSTLLKKIMEETILVRGKKKALDLLSRRDHTEQELRDKLKKGGYTKNMIERIITYVDSYHYLDDARYLDAYLSYHKSNKSIRQLKMELQKKGLDSALIAEALEQDAWSDYTAIQKAIAKKTNQIENLSYEEKKKIAAYLFRKGFTESDIRKHLLL